jgi:hypothetical protein
MLINEARENIPLVTPEAAQKMIEDGTNAWKEAGLPIKDLTRNKKSYICI